MAQDSVKIPAKKAVRRAGEKLRTPGLSESEIEEALQALSDWRMLYYRPTTAIQVLIRKKVSAL